MATVIFFNELTSLATDNSVEKIYINNNYDSQEIVNVKEYGCIYDGITDDSSIIKKIDSNFLYFPEGNIVVDSETVKILMRKNICGPGIIHIKDFFKFKQSKFSDNGLICANDINNPYIGSINLPNDMIPDTGYVHQIENGWINRFETISNDYQMYAMTGWGQVFPAVGTNYSDDEIITICFSEMEYGYYDTLSSKWVTKKKLPNIWGVYDKNYKSVEDGGLEKISTDKLKIKKYKNYEEVSFPYSYIRNRVLHFGWKDDDFPSDKIFVKGNYGVWAKSTTYSNAFVANMGFDLYVYENGINAVKEYCGSRSIAITDNIKNICLAYVNNRYELLR